MRKSVLEKAFSLLFLAAQPPTVRYVQVECFERNLAECAFNNTTPLLLVTVFSNTFWSNIDNKMCKLSV